MSASKKSGGKRFLFLGRATQSRHYILTLAWKRLWLGVRVLLNIRKRKEWRRKEDPSSIITYISCFLVPQTLGFINIMDRRCQGSSLQNRSCAKKKLRFCRSTRSPQNKRNKSGLLDSSWRLLTASWQAARSQILILNENIAISKPFQTNNIYTYRLGDEERTLMHLVPAPAVRLIQRQDSSRPGVYSLMSRIWREKRLDYCKSSTSTNRYNPRYTMRRIDRRLVAPRQEEVSI